MPKFQSGGVDIPDAAGLGYSRSLGVEGSASDGSNATPVMFPQLVGELTSRLNLPPGETVLTRAIMRTGILTSRNAGSTTITLPTIATLGWTDPGDGSQNPFFLFQRCGLGGLYVNPVAGVDIIWNDLDPQFLAQYTAVGGLIYCGIDGVTTHETWAAF